MRIISLPLDQLILLAVSKFFGKKKIFFRWLFCNSRLLWVVNGCYILYLLVCMLYAYFSLWQLCVWCFCFFSTVAEKHFIILVLKRSNVKIFVQTDKPQTDPQTLLSRTITQLYGAGPYLPKNRVKTQVTPDIFFSFKSSAVWPRLWTEIWTV